MRALHPAQFLALMMGCVATVGEPEPTPEPTPEATPTPEPTPSIEDAFEPCADLWDDAAAGRLFVLATAPAGGTGGLTDPFATVVDALAASRPTGARSIALGPGSYTASLTLSDVFGDNDLVIEGCGPSLTVLNAVVPSSGPVLPTIDVSGATTVNVQVRQLTLDGGRPTSSSRAAQGPRGRSSSKTCCSPAASGSVR